MVLICHRITAFIHHLVGRIDTIVVVLPVSVIKISLNYSPSCSHRLYFLLYDPRTTSTYTRSLFYS